MSNLPRIAYYISDDDQIIAGALVSINEPDEELAESGAQTLYDFGHGFSTPTIFETKQEAQEALNEKGDS